MGACASSESVCVCVRVCVYKELYCSAFLYPCASFTVHTHSPMGGKDSCSLVYKAPSIPSFPCSFFPLVTLSSLLPSSFSLLLSFHSFSLLTMASIGKTYTTTIQPYSKYGATTVGRDKFYRAVQYGARALAYYAATYTNTSPETIKRLTALKAAIGQARKCMYKDPSSSLLFSSLEKNSGNGTEMVSNCLTHPSPLFLFPHAVMRVGKPLDHLQSLVSSTQQPDDFLRLAGILRYASLAAYLTFDMLQWVSLFFHLMIWDQADLSLTLPSSFFSPPSPPCRFTRLERTNSPISRPIPVEPQSFGSLESSSPGSRVFIAFGPFGSVGSPLSVLRATRPPSP